MNQNDSATRTYKSIDLFAGIGGIRLGFDKAFGDSIETILMSDKDKFARATYFANFNDNIIIDTDIKALSVDEIPDFDILLAGFPCQPFSSAGIPKKNNLGYAHGFADKTSGTLFFDVARILNAKRPDAFLLENVKNLMSHDKRNTWKVIERVLTDELGYHIHTKVIDATEYTRQHRERIYIVGFKDDLSFDWDDLQVNCLYNSVGDILLDNDEVDEKYTISDKMWDWHQRHAAKHAARGNGFGYGIVNTDSSRTKTLSARYYKDGAEILVEQKGKNPRKLTPRECARLQGFPDDFEFPVSDTQAYKQCGNSVCVPVIESVAMLMKRTLDEREREER